MLKRLQFMSTILIAAVVLPVAARPAVADDAESDRPDNAGLFADLDTNGDGTLAEDEVPEEHRRLFRRLVRTADSNDDGSLTVEEFTAGISGDPDGDRGPDKPDRPRGPRDGKRPPRDGDGPPREGKRPPRDGDGPPREGKRPPRDGDGPPRDRPNPKRIFQHLDDNGDGKVTIDEVPEERRERFQRLIERADKDGDEALSLGEFSRAMSRGRPRPDADGRPPRGPEGRPEGRPGRPGGRRPEGRPGRPPQGRPEPGRFFERLDADGDGRVTLEEVPEEGRPRLERLIERLDKDGDGAITKEEFAAMRRGAQGRPPQGRPQDGVRPERPDQPDGPRPPGADRRPPRGRPGPPPQLMRALDSDRDGQLSAEEIQAASEAIRKLDRDGDGNVTAQELGAPRRERKNQD